MKTMHCIFFMFAVFFISVPNVASATSSLTITEIMYDLSGTDSGHEWVEVYNSGSTTVSIVGGSGAGSFRFNDGSNHFLAQTPAMGSITIPAGGYFIFADDAPTFLNDHPGFSGTLIDTTISLPNTTGVVKVIDGDGNVLASISYTSSQGASGDGNTLQLSGSSWISAVPTPSAPSATSASNTQSGTNTGSTTSGTQPANNPGATPDKSLSTTVAYESPQMKAVVSAPISATVGIPIKISATVYGTAKEYRQAGVFYFALGDGFEYESRTPPVFEHTYAYPGEYVILFEYRTSNYMTDPEVSFRQVIEVSSPSVVISSRNIDGAPVLTNTSDDDADISGWWVETNGEKFRIPRGTIILPGKSITVPMKNTGTVLASTSSVQLLLPLGIVVSEYQEHPTPVVLATIETVPTVVQTPVVQSSVQKSSPVVASATPLLLSASVIDSVREKENETPQSPPKSILIFFIGLVGILLASFLVLRKVYVRGDREKDVSSSASSQTQELADSIRIIDGE